MSRSLIEIKRDVHKVNPMFTDELLDLLCEYVIASLRDKYSIDKEISAMKENADLQKLIMDLTIRNLK